MLTRRTVLQAGVAMAAAAVLPEAMSSGAEATKVDLERYPLIDAHTHLWSPKTEKWPLADGKTEKDLDPPSFTPEEFFKLAHPQKVGRAVLIQHHTYHAWNNTYLTDCAKAYPGAFSVVGMIDDQQIGVEKRMDDLLKQQVRGFRITPWIYKEKWLQGAGMEAMWKHGAETGQSMCCLIDAKDIPGVNAMCKANLETTVVIDHFARIGVDGKIRDEDVQNLCNLAKYKKTYAKLSAFYALGKKEAPYLDLLPMIRKVLDAFGPERCMWASDSPYQVVKGHDYPSSIELIRDRLDGLSTGDKDWLLRKTAEKVFFAEG